MTPKKTARKGPKIKAAPKKKATKTNGHNLKKDGVKVTLRPDSYYEARLAGVGENVKGKRIMVPRGLQALLIKPHHMIPADMIRILQDLGVLPAEKPRVESIIDLEKIRKESDEAIFMLERVASKAHDIQSLTAAVVPRAPMQLRQLAAEEMTPGATAGNIINQVFRHSDKDQDAILATLISELTRKRASRVDQTDNSLRIVEGSLATARNSEFELTKILQGDFKVKALNGSTVREAPGVGNYGAELSRTDIR